jgi:hypothetical protein
MHPLVTLIKIQVWDVTPYRSVAVKDASYAVDASIFRVWLVYSMWRHEAPPKRWSLLFRFSDTPSPPVVGALWSSSLNGWRRSWYRVSEKSMWVCARGTLNCGESGESPKHTTLQAAWISNLPTCRLGVASNTYRNHDNFTFAVTGTLTYSRVPTGGQVVFAHPLLDHSIQNNNFANYFVDCPTRLLTAREKCAFDMCGWNCWGHRKNRDGRQSLNWHADIIIHGEDGPV